MNDKEIQLVHETSLRILEDIGVRLEHDEILQRVLKAGAGKGAGNYDVCFPRKMVIDYLSMAPASFDLLDTEGGKVGLSSNSDSIFWTNPALRIWRNGRIKDIESQDAAIVAKLCDNLHNVHGVMGMAMADIPPKACDFTGVRIIAENCSKHVRALCFSPEGAEVLAEMKKVFDGNWLSIGFTAHGPLRWTNLALGIFLKSAGHAIPVTVNGEPIVGVTCPVTLAGSIAVGNAEILSGIVINQIIEPKRPVIYNLGLAHTFDMRQATTVTGGPENALLAVASAEMGRFYNIPSASWVSTESVFDDGQATIEKTFGIHTHSTNKSTVIWGLGQLESEKTISLTQLAIDNEIIDYARRYEQGFLVNEKTLQYDLIKTVGIGGSFLETEHTLTNFRQNLWEPKLINRKVRENCPSTLEQKATNWAEDIIAKDTHCKIGDDQLNELKRIEQYYLAKI